MSSLIIKKFIKHNLKLFHENHYKDNHATVLKKGIEFILTCFGSVGYEYSYLGCTVINACKENLHSAYQFNLNPKTINEYKKIITNFLNYKIKLNKKKVLELFFLRKLYLNSNWLSVDKNLKKKFEWKNDIYKPSMYKIWMQQMTLKKHHEILKKINNFIDTKKFRLFNKDL